MAALATVFQGCSSAQILRRFPIPSGATNVRAEALESGVSYATWTTTAAVIHVLKVDLRSPRLLLRPVLGHESLEGGGPQKRESPVSMARRSGALAFINSDYYGPMDNVEGLTIIDGRVLLAPMPPRRSAVVLGRDRRVWIGKLHPTLNPEIDFFQGFGGGPQILTAGVFRWDSLPRTINGEDFSVPDGKWDKPQSVAGLCVDGNRMFWIVAHAVAPAHGVGMTPWELGGLMASLHCHDGVRLDGGGSVAMVLRGKLVSTPFPKFLEGKPIGSGLGLFYR